MTLSERLLTYFCVPAGAATKSTHKTSRTTEDALELLDRVYPNLPDLISNRSVLDFGCGAGLQSIAMVQRHGCTVTGLDTNTAALDVARENARRHDVDGASLTFIDRLEAESQGTFDVVVAKDSFEHFDDPAGALRAMASVIHDDGLVLISFGPPWLAPYGSHMHFFCKLPWVNVLFPEKTVMRVRSRYRNDGAMRYEDVESGLNRMTVRRFERLVGDCNLHLQYRRYDCVRGLNFLARLPGLREFFINHVTVALTRRSSHL